jgi:hypothetical protein
MQRGAGAMSCIDRILPTPRLLERDSTELTAPRERIWEGVRHAELVRTPFMRALFAHRASAAREGVALVDRVLLRLDDARSSPLRPGVAILAEEPGTEVILGVIGKVWQPDVPLVHVDGAEAFTAFDAPDFVKIAVALRLAPRPEGTTELEIEVRIDATDDASWRKFQRYFATVGPAARFVRRVLLASLTCELGDPDVQADARAMPGDELLPDAEAQVTHAILVDVAPERVWPWLLRMGCHRAGYYSVDRLEDRTPESGGEVDPELEVGDMIPATPDGATGFEVLAIEPGRSLLLGGLYDPDAGQQLDFGAPRPERYWQSTWSFVLEAVDGPRVASERPPSSATPPPAPRAGRSASRPLALVTAAPLRTRLTVRARGAFPPGQRIHAAWIRPVHHLLHTGQLRHLAARAEGRLPHGSALEALEAVGGGGALLVAIMTPFSRPARSSWGLGEMEASWPLPGDALVAEPRWEWTHAVEIDAEAHDVWPWLAQIGADHAGFYTATWLDALGDEALHETETLHEEWTLRAGDALRLHPEVAPLTVVEVAKDRYLVAHGAPDEAARAARKPWVAASWALVVEPLDGARSRVVSRVRASCSESVAARLAAAHPLVEPVGFTVDRRMLLGLKERVEDARILRSTRLRTVV